MEVSPELLIAAGGIITVTSTLVSSWAVSRRSARKDALKSLQEEVERQSIQITALTEKNNIWQKKFDRIYAYVLKLRKIISDFGTMVPEMPDWDCTPKKKSRKSNTKKGV
jgi:Tfp pilus assembly protein PilN